jgi:hypothetical protein
MACAIVTAAGTPYLRWVAIAPAASVLMNACCELEPGGGVMAAAGWCRVYRARG